MLNPQTLAIEDFTYLLTEDKIAQFPLCNRSDSKLILFNQESDIKHYHFFDLPKLVDAGSLFIMNNTKVIQARLVFYKSSGARIELFCLEPFEKVSMEFAFQSKGKVKWQCMVGNAKKWKNEELFFNVLSGNQNIKIIATKVGIQDDLTVIEFKWEPPSLTFSEILSTSGLMPLPPYMKRRAVETDKETYNTIYAKNEGSVAAPTAGLHFTSEIIELLKGNNCVIDYVTLHVGAGTFKPVKSEVMAGHIMHEEQIVVSLSTLELLRDKIDQVPIIAVGTTSTRTLESCYWHAVLLMKNTKVGNEVSIGQWLPYSFQENELPSAKAALIFLCDWMIENNFQNLGGSTQIIIAPSYKFKIIDALITNFHQPQSTLLLLVAALIGDDWRKVYSEALENNYRFLSYGDSSLLFKSNNI